MLCLITSNLILSVLWNTFAIKNLYLCLYAHKYHKHYIIYKYSLVSSATSNTILWHILTELLNKWCDYLLVLYLMYTYSVYKVAYIIWLKTRRRYITFKLISFFSVRSFQVKNFSSLTYIHIRKTSCTSRWWKTFIIRDNLHLTTHTHIHL